MFNQTITIFKKILNKATRQDEYKAQIINNALYDNSSALSTLKNGVEAKYKAVITIPDTSFNIEIGDVICEGIELDYKKGHTVIAVDYKNFNSGLDHIEVLV